MTCHRFNTRETIARAARLNLVTATDEAIEAQLRATARAGIVADVIEIAACMAASAIVIGGMIAGFLYLSGGV